MNAARLILVLTGWSGAWFRNGTVWKSWRLLRNSHAPVLIAGRRDQSRRAEYRRVLVAVDGSQTSVSCIEQARAIAPAADMVVVHALADTQERRMLRAGLAEEQIRESRIQHHEQAYDRINLLLEHAGVAPAEVVKVVENAYAPSLILETEKSFRADLLIVGRSSAPLLRRFFFRAVAPQVLAGAQCDVLIVPPASAAQELRKDQKNH